MIKALYQLGKYYESVHVNSGLLNIIENPNEKGNYNNVIVLEFEYKDKKISYNGFRLEEFSEEKIEKYLYKKGTARGGNFTPTLILNTKEIEKSLSNLLRPLKKIKRDEFEKTLEFLENDEKIKEIAIKINQSIKNKEGYILTLNINDKWLNDYEEVIAIINKSNFLKYTTRSSFSKYEKESIGKEKYCYVCKKKKESVYGFVNTFNFYTLDKKGFMTGGFNRKYAWKNYPVCPACSKTLENGKKYLIEKFSNRFAGFSYFIVPKFIFNIESEDNYKVYKRVLKNLSENEKISLEECKKELLIIAEDRILNKLANEKNNIIMDIIFYKEDKAAFNILKSIEDVLPSRLNELFVVKSKIEDHKIFESSLIKGKKGVFEKKYYFNFGTIREFFPNSKIEGVFDDTFLEIMNSIFIDKKIDKNLMINAFIRKIRNAFVDPEHKEYQIEDLVKNSLLIYKFLIELNLFNNLNKKEVKAVIEINEKNKKYVDFFNEHFEVFDSDLKRGVFLVGVLTSNLLNLPEQRNKPFYSRLNSLKVDEKIIKRIMVEAINKLNEYGKNYYMALEKLISEYLTLADFKELSKDELSYYFVTGMNLVKVFKTKENNEEENILEELIDE